MHTINNIICHYSTHKVSNANIAHKQVIGLQDTICRTLARYSVFLTPTAVVEQTAGNGYPGTRFNTRRVPGYLNPRKSEH